MATGRIQDIVNLCLYDSTPKLIDTLEVAGVVTSDFRSGCFYQRVALTDDTGYIEVLVDDRLGRHILPYGAEATFTPLELYATVRRNVVVVGKGKTVEEPDGTIIHNVIPLGYPDDFFRFRITGHAALQPMDGEITRPQADKQGFIVSFDDVQFTSQHLGQPWGDYRSLHDVFRHITNRDGNTFPVMVPSYGWFAYRMLPSGSGHIEGIMQRSRRNGYQYLKVFDPRKIHMENERFEATPKGPFLSEKELM